MNLYPDWPAVAYELNLRLGGDDKVVDALCNLGVRSSLDRSTLAHIRAGRVPRFDVGTAMLELLKQVPAGLAPRIGGPFPLRGYRDHYRASMLSSIKGIER